MQGDCSQAPLAFLTRATAILHSSFPQGLLILVLTFLVAVRGGKNFWLASRREFSTSLYTVSGLIGKGYVFKLRLSDICWFHCGQNFLLKFQTGLRVSGLGSSLDRDINIGRWSLPQYGPTFNSTCVAWLADSRVRSIVEVLLVLGSILVGRSLGVTRMRS